MVKRRSRSRDRRSRSGRKRSREKSPSNSCGREREWDDSIYTNPPPSRNGNAYEDRRSSYSNSYASQKNPYVDEVNQSRHREHDRFDRWGHRRSSPPRPQLPPPAAAGHRVLPSGRVMSGGGGGGRGRGREMTIPAWLKNQPQMERSQLQMGTAYPLPNTSQSESSFRNEYGIANERDQHYGRSSNIQSRTDVHPNQPYTEPQYRSNYGRNPDFQNEHSQRDSIVQYKHSKYDEGFHEEKVSPRSSNHGKHYNGPIDHMNRGYHDNNAIDLTNENVDHSYHEFNESSNRVQFSQMHIPSSEVIGDGKSYSNYSSNVPNLLGSDSQARHPPLHNTYGLVQQSNYHDLQKGDHYYQTSEENHGMHNASSQYNQLHSIPVNNTQNQPFAVSPSLSHQTDPVVSSNQYQKNDTYRQRNNMNTEAQQLHPDDQNSNVHQIPSYSEENVAVHNAVPRVLDSFERLPHDWKAVNDPRSNAVYYWNVRSNEVRWEKPTG